jgi:hypothetical protein
VAHDGGVHDEAPELRVLEEHAVDARRVAIGTGDNRLEIVLDEPLDDPTEKHPGGFEPVQDGGQILAQADPEKRVAAIAQGDQQPVDAPALPPVGIEPEAEQAEIDLGGFARWGLGHADGDARSAEVEMGAGEAMERAIGDAEALRLQAAINLRQAQPLRQPRRDLVAVRSETVGEVTGPANRDGVDGREDGRHVLVGRRRIAPTQPRGDRRGHVLANGLPVAPGPPRDGAQTVPHAEPAQHFAYFDHTQLPIGHDHLLRGSNHGPAWPPGPGWGKGFEKPLGERF